MMICRMLELEAGLVVVDRFLAWSESQWKLCHRVSDASNVSISPNNRCQFVARNKRRLMEE